MREFSTWVVICLLIGVAVIASQPGRISLGGLLGSMGFRNDETHISWSNGTSRVEVRNRGAIVAISEDDRDILQIMPNGYLTISDDGLFRSGRRLELRSRADGTIERKFFANGRELEYDPDGKAWLAEMLPELVRRTGLAAETRVERILKAEGVAGVLAEISLIKSDHVERKYFATLFDRARPAGQPFAQALTQAGQQIKSDYELRELLNSIVREAISDEAARNAYFDAALTIHSDYELATLLILVAETQPLDATLGVPYFAALETVNSDYEHRRVLSVLVDRVLDPAILLAMLRSLSGVDSDYEAAEFLTSLAESHTLEGGLRTAYLEAAGQISSEYERNRALAALVGNERRK